jgi:hypothetical protein
MASEYGIIFPTEQKNLVTSRDIKRNCTESRQNFHCYSVTPYTALYQRLLVVFSGSLLLSRQTYVLFCGSTAQPGLGHLIVEGSRTHTN